MRTHRPPSSGLMAVLLALALALISVSSTSAADKAWLKNWEQKKTPWRALHLIGPQPQRLDLTRQLITEFLVPMRFNVLILEVNYGFEYKSHPELNCHGLNPKQARELTDFCRKQGIRLIPLKFRGHNTYLTNNQPRAEPVVLRSPAKRGKTRIGRPLRGRLVASKPRWGCCS